MTVAGGNVVAAEDDFVAEAMLVTEVEDVVIITHDID